MRIKLKSKWESALFVAKKFYYLIHVHTVILLFAANTDYPKIINVLAYQNAVGGINFLMKK